MSEQHSIKDISWQGENLQLLAHKGIYWPTEKTLFVADPHFGKQPVLEKLGSRFQNIQPKMTVKDY